VLQALDHVVIATRDLSAAEEQTTALLGRPPTWRGEHPGAGTANRLYRLANTTLELLAPEGDGALGERIAAALDARGDGMLALAFACDDAAEFAASLRARGVAAEDPREGDGRDPATGATRHWRTVNVPPNASRGLPVFAIERPAGEDPAPVDPAGADPAALPLSIDHVVVISADLDASRSFYRDLLGLRLALDRTFEARGARILFFRVGGVTVEIGGKIGGGEPGGDRFGGIAYRVEDADAARARLIAVGFDVSEVRAGAKSGTRVCTVRGEPCGVPTLLVEPADRVPPSGVRR
jgi:catechol 2,3-dioxygenase-like lactoylglutathione lyase family enzyme